ncbi:hypothetical protein OG21DRAFT_1211132 [Imleria badia]|nr:hypothetical protein OG21DRAFT_1211132 [Imleria badia]
MPCNHLLPSAVYCVATVFIATLGHALTCVLVLAQGTWVTFFSVLNIITQYVFFSINPFDTRALCLALLRPQTSLENAGGALSDDILSFCVIIFVSVAGWAPITADYNVSLPVDAKPWHVSMLTLSVIGVFARLVLILCSYRRQKESFNNVLNTYSAALSIQVLGRPFAMVPRFLWVSVVFIAYTVADVAGREHFRAILHHGGVGRV